MMGWISPGGIAGAVQPPPSLCRATNIDAILQAANEIQAEDPTVARIRMTKGLKGTFESKAVFGYEDFRRWLSLFARSIDLVEIEQLGVKFFFPSVYALKESFEFRQTGSSFFSFVLALMNCLSKAGCEDWQLQQCFKNHTYYPFVLPCVGNDAYTLFLVATLLFLSKGRMVEFAKYLANFAAASGKKHVVLLSSLDFGKWQKIDMSSKSFLGNVLMLWDITLATGNVVSVVCRYNSYFTTANDGDLAILECEASCMVSQLRVTSTDYNAGGSSDYLAGKVFTNKKISNALDEFIFLLWKHQILLVVRSHRLERLLTRVLQPPAATILGAYGLMVENEDYEVYMSQDNALASWILSNISPFLLPQLIGVETAAEV
ncbi:allene oxide synthase [Hibiscus syriacus]|uniref:Allene oxide synthase n=1 Tax=Hibiscus syriacus TaxID=106335 RepID=A0A6A3C883_HIBSY|nr:allene oxide synthase [Hibiscus syriacus]